LPCSADGTIKHISGKINLVFPVALAYIALGLFKDYKNFGISDKNKSVAL